MSTPGYLSNAELAAKLSAVVDRWNVRENQMIALISQPDGTVIVTDGLGNDHELPSFPQLQLTVSQLVDSATGAVAQATDISAAVSGLVGAAESSATTAQHAANTATSAKDAAQAAQGAAASSASAAAGSTATATNAATTATQAADTATTQAAAASTASTAAQTARTGAEAARDAAQTSAGQVQAIVDAAGNVVSVAGKTGVVTLAAGDITGLQEALDGKAQSDHAHSDLPLSGGTLTGILGIHWINGGESPIHLIRPEGQRSVSLTTTAANETGCWSISNNEWLWRIDNGNNAHFAGKVFAQGGFHGVQPTHDPQFTGRVFVSGVGFVVNAWESQHSELLFQDYLNRRVFFLYRHKDSGYVHFERIDPESNTPKGSFFVDAAGTFHFQNIIIAPRVIDKARAIRHFFNQI